MMRKIPILNITAVLACLIVLLTTSRSGRAGVISPSLQSALKLMAPDETVSVIVRLSDRVDTLRFRKMPRVKRRAPMIRALRQKARLSQRPLESFLSKKGVKHVKSFWLINALAVICRADLIHELASYPGVESVRLNTTVRLSDLLPATTAVPEWNIGRVNADGVWSMGATGQGVVVAIMDSGADRDHPDLKDRWRSGANSWFDPNGEHPDGPYDADGHGTQVLGIIVGGDAGGTSIGAAPQAKWIAVKIFGDNGTADLVTIHEGFQWLLDPDGNPDTDDAPDIVNNSWALLGSIDQCEGEQAYDEFHDDIQILKTSGIAVVFSGGNDGPNPATSISPANDVESFAVGFVDDSDTIADASSRGPSGCGLIYPEVVAPGVTVRTADLTWGGLFPNSYTSRTGTSFAAPHVTGVMALLLSSFPDASIPDIEQALTNSALDLGDPGPDNDYGNGLIDAMAAYNLLDGAGFTPCIRPDVGFTATPFPGNIGAPVTFTASVKGGIPPYNYAWDVDGDGVADYDTLEFTHEYNNFYNGTVGLTVTDANGCSAKLFIADNWAVCSPITVNFTANPDPGVVDSLVRFVSTVSGGNAPYRYDWDVDGDNITDCETADCTHIYTAPYDSIVKLTVTDKFGCAADPYTENFIVKSGNNPSGGGGGICFVSTITSGDNKKQAKR